MDCELVAKLSSAKSDPMDLSHIAPGHTAHLIATKQKVEFPESNVHWQTTYKQSTNLIKHTHTQKTNPHSLCSYSNKSTLFTQAPTF